MNPLETPFIKTIRREIAFTARDHTVWFWMIIVTCLSVLSVAFGQAEIKHQHVQIQSLVQANEASNTLESSKWNDWGSAAFYHYHMTYDAPSDFAFAALGQRDNQPWKHRIRMLALEGQIYERDVSNPSITIIGRFDFSFLAAFVFPLILIMLLYDLRASEIKAGRYHLLVSSVSHIASLWPLRTILRTTAVLLCLLVPMIFAGAINGTSLSTLLQASIMVLLFTLFWSVVCYIVSAWRQSSAIILTTLVGLWVVTAVVLPAGAKVAIDKAVPLPSGADILLHQRETVNDAWDIPKEITMNNFLQRHPKWANYQPKPPSFDWPWYYAFQQVGDQATENLSTAYRNGRLQRDRIAGWVSLIAPSSLLERSLQSLANTGTAASIDYEDRVRIYHSKLREFYYPKLFRHEPYDKTHLNKVPRFNGR
ncbi:DUF3526 domain-containing protein [Marinagarivorans algicola]|uniref:DUF3526 domain-containing protein n=1 Tax=Marinagarivorans algicola TaxID=1513270 RepID=UPI0006B4F833|nr:DUF3526 domain-containing protein [Marinagarivorans algicola]